MHATPSLDRPTEPTSVEVRWRRRTYPLPAEPSQAASDPPTNRIYQLREQPEEKALPDLLGEALWSLLPWSELPSDELDRQAVIEAYVGSLSQLERCQAEAKALIEACCEANLEFRQEVGETYLPARDKALKSQLSAMLSEAGDSWLPIRNILQAKLVSQPLPELRQRLHDALVTGVKEFSTEFFELLARLVDRELFGLVEWHPNHCCSYHFFKRVVIQENQGASQQVTTSYRNGRLAEVDSDEGDTVIGTRRTKTVRGKGQHTHRLARHEHGVMQAIRTSIGNSQVIMPPPVERLVNRVPAWLAPFVQVIDGQIFRERIIERDLKVAKWEDVEVRDEPILGWEPAVIIGPYVLTGWGPREVEQERTRRRLLQESRQSEGAVQSATYRFPALIVAATLLTLIAVTLLIQSYRGQASVVFSLLATATAIGCVWQAVYDFAIQRRYPRPFLSAHWMTGSIGLQILLAEWLVARWFGPLSWLTPVVLALGAIGCYVAGKHSEAPPSE